MATKTVTVERTELVSEIFAGKALTLPHSEHGGDEFSTNTIRFGDDGVALVHPNQAAAVEEFYPRQARVGRTGVKVNFEIEVPDVDEDE